MLRNCKFIVCLMMLFLVIGVAFAQSPQTKQYGPQIQTFISDFQDTHNFSMTFFVYVTGDRKNPTVRLNYYYYYADWATSEFRNETFDGVIPSSSLTWSGVPEYNGDVTTTLVVDTSTIDLPDASKSGTGGPIAITWTQDPAATVYNTTGESTAENSSFVSKSTGRVVWTNFKFNGTFFGKPVSEAISNWSAIYFYDYTVINKTQK